MFERDMFDYHANKFTLKPEVFLGYDLADITSGV